jgi:protein-disulfide isomerase
MTPTAKKKFGAALAVVAALAATVFVSRENNWSVSWRVPSYRQMGPASARVALVVYSDFQCPSCAKAQGRIKSFMQKHEGKLFLVYRHFPLENHKWSFLASQAAEAAGAQKKFWDYHDLLFTRQEEWAKSPEAPDGLFIKYAGELGLEAEAFKADFKSGKRDELIRRDKKEGKDLNVSATPTIFINQRRVVGDQQLESVGERYIELELQR